MTILDETGSPYTGLASVLGRRRNPYDLRRNYGYSLLTKSMAEQPIDHPMQGVARLAQALVGGWMTNKADRDEKAAEDKMIERIAAAGAIADPQERLKAYTAINPEIGMRYSAQLAVEQAKLQEQRRALQGADLSAGYGLPPASSPPGSREEQAISGIESGGRYDAVGPVANAQGNRAYGKYGVMDFNVGPWTQEVLGKAMTPQEFLVNPQAQDAVFKAKFAQYTQQYGSPQAAARAWFAGPRGMNNPDARDVNDMTVANYERKFNQIYNAGVSNNAPQPITTPSAQVGPSPAPVAQPPAPSPQIVAQAAPPQGMPQPPVYPNVPRQEPTAEIIARHNRILRSGGYGPNLAEAEVRARAAIEDELKQLQARKQEIAKAEYDRKLGDYKDQLKQIAEGPKTLFEQEGKMRDDFSKEPAVKSFRIVVPMLESAKDAVTRPTRAADLNLIYAFAKLMDPDSVVRESETGAVVATASVAERLQAYIGQLNGQAMLNPDMRRKLIAELNSRFGPLKASHDALLDQYSAAARHYGLEPARIFYSVRQPPPGTPLPAAPANGPVRIDINGDPL
jgi:outer membrane lipopolysaccharide assembly protein LptE/RlpB